MMRSLVAWSLLWAYMVAAGLLSLPGIWLTGRLEFTYAAARLGLRMLFRLAGVRIEVQGSLPAYPPEVAPIYMANHQSNLDAPILVTHLPGNIVFLGKRKLFSVPILGLVLKSGGLIPVDRSGDREAARATVGQAAAAVRAGRPVLVFPEGTRSPDGMLLEFKKGPFYLVEEARAPVIPVRIEGSGVLLPRGSWRIRPGVVKLWIGAPLQPEAWAGSAEPREALAAAVRARLSPLELR
ncbi:MAG: lysophospholipid acyltransferase family protein [Terriglobales bacterium]